MGLKHLWGIPIEEQSLSMGLCWTTSWRTSGLERKAFPSWSWARWKAQVNFDTPRHPTSIVATTTRFPSGEEFDVLRDTSHKGNLGTICLGSVLRITGYFLTFVSFVVESVVEGEGYMSVVYRVILSACGTDISIRAYPDMAIDRPLLVADLEGAEVLEVEPFNRDAIGKYAGQFLLVRKHMGAYRRVGAAVLTPWELLGEQENIDIEPERFEVGMVPMEGRHLRTINLI